MIAISTSYKDALIGIEINNKSIFKTLDANCKHSENILKTIDELLDSINETINNVNKIAVVVGPGSFTGIRIAIALLKGFICGNDKILVCPITTFDLMAYTYLKNSHTKENFVCVINALSDLYYVCEYSFNGEKIGNEKICNEEELNQIKEKKIGLFSENIMKDNIQPSAQDLLELAKKKDEQGLFKVEKNDILPLYLRKSQAEDGLENKIKNFNKI